MNLNPYIQGQIDEALKSRNEIEGFIITDKDIGVPTVWMCPWVGHHHNVALPNVGFNINKLPDGWRDELSSFEGIQALHILTDVEDLDFAKDFKNLKELYIFDSSCKDWSFLSELMELDTLFVYKAPCFDTAPVRVLMEKQVLRLGKERAEAKAKACNTLILPMSRVLNEILLNYCNLTNDSLLDLATNKSITELNLSHNLISSIDNLSDVAVYYLTLRYNQLTDIEMLQYAPYYLNVRHNSISRLPDFKEMKRCQLARLYADYNSLPDTEIDKAKKLRLLKTDLY